MMEVRKIKKRFGGMKEVKNVYLKLKKGEILGLIGKNGDGKKKVVGIIRGQIYK